MIDVIEPVVRPTKKKNRKGVYRSNIYRHMTYRKGKRGPFRGLVQALYDNLGIK